MEIARAVKELLKIVSKLQSRYPAKKFTLDGRLVGDIGEILVAHHYDVELFEGLHRHHDGQDSKNRRVQIKTTMKDSLTFPCDHIPDHYLGIKVFPDGSFEEIYNGDGRTIAYAIKNRKKTKNNLHSISLSKLRALNGSANAENRISKRDR